MNYLAASDRFYLDSPGGAYRVAWDLARLMRDRGHRATLLCGSVPKDPPAGLEEVEGITVVRYRIPSGRSFRPLERQMDAAQAQLAKDLPDAKWDIVHSHLPASGLAAFRHAQRSATRIATVHSPIVDEQRINWAGRGLSGQVKTLLGVPLLRAVERELLSQAHRIHCLSSFTRSRMLAEHPRLGEARFSVIPWWSAEGPAEPVEANEARRQLGWPLGKPVLLTVRRLTPRMGLSVLVRAVAPILDRFDASLMMVGEGPERAALEREIASQHAGQRIRLLGRLSDAQVSLAYAAADLFVLPTLALECFGLIVIEALSAGCPVIGTSVGAIPELLVGGHFSRLCPPGDSAALRSAVRSFLAGEWKPSSRGEIARYAREHFGRAQLEARYLQWMTET